MGIFITLLFSPRQAHLPPNLPPSLQLCNRQLFSNLQFPGKRATDGPPRCPHPASYGCSSTPRANPVHPPRRQQIPDTRGSDPAPALPSVCKNQSPSRPCHGGPPATCSP